MKGDNIPVTVTTFNVQTTPPTVLTERIINLKRSDSREWLNAHITWASGQGHGVQVEPVGGR